MKQILNLVKTATRSQRVLKGHVNREGAPSFRRDLREQAVNILTTGTLGNTFYASKDVLAKEAVGVLLKARDEQPGFLARALVYARNDGFMRTLPILGLVALSGNRRSRELFESSFDRVVLIPDDLRLFVALCRSGNIPGRNGLGGVASLAVKRWLTRMSEYHAVKYGSAVSAEVTLRDIIRMTHPKPSSKAAAERFGWLVRGDSGLGSDPSLNPQIRMLEILKSMPTLEAQIAVLKNSNLPYEVVVPSMKGTNTEVWEALFMRAPYFNLLRNLATFTRHGVFAKEENVERAIGRLTDGSAIGRSKVLPFRFFDAWKAYSQIDGADSRIANAIRDALELSFVNMPALGGVVGIGTDVSGSMAAGTISDKSSTRCIDIAGVFTGALLRKIEDRAIPLPFEGRLVRDHGLTSRDGILTTAEKIVRIGGGSTAVGAPIEYLLNRKIPVDVFVGITDNEDWAYGRGYDCSGNFLDLWRRYKKQVAPGCKAYLLTITPHRDAVAPASERDVHFIYGWSDRVMRYIALDSGSGESQIQAIERMSLGPVDPNGTRDHEDAQTDDD